MSHLALRIFLSIALFVAVARGESVRFAVLSDTQGISDEEVVNTRVLPVIVENVLRADPPVQFVVVTGDIVNGSGDKENLRQQYALWRQIVQPWYDSAMIGCKVYALPGNHDHRTADQDGEAWRQAFPELPDNGPEGEKKMTYSFDVGGCHFAAVKTYTPGAGYRANSEWLAQDLAASAAPVKFVFGHAPAFPAMLHVRSSLDEFLDLRDAFWSVLVDNSVKAYFCGHEHMSDHWMKDDVHQIVTGGGGGFSLFFHYLIVDADESDVTVTVHRYTGEVDHQYAFSQTEAARTEDRSYPERSVYTVLPCLPVFGIGLAVGIFGFGMLSRYRND